MFKTPLAIIGIGCRFPGGISNVVDFWKALCNKVDAISCVPADRWDTRKFYDSNIDKPGKMYIKEGGFLEGGIDKFDSTFFGISPREAMSMDPQQRLLLEVTWEAIEDAGFAIEKLQNCTTGVFIGGFCLDNLLLQCSPLNRELINSHVATNVTMTMLSNRISHVFNFKGPSVSMDTACSSSLVATHFACRSIWCQDCDIAIVGGVNVIFVPENSIEKCKSRLLSRHCRCMAFDERADGYVRAEGCGIIIIKPLYKAINDSDRIYAVIKETGVNQDGHTYGITLPNPDAQQHLIEKVYTQAGVTPQEVTYVEAHGTGTQAGDFAEVNALNKVFSNNNVTSKCIVGSVKTNIGHLEAAAGVAGLIKTALCLKYQQIPPNLHFEHPNPKLNFQNMHIRVPTTLEPWPAENGCKYAGVNSFGYGGTNAHVLLQETPVLKKEDSTKSKYEAAQPMLITLSVNNGVVLRALTNRYLALLLENDTEKQNNISLLDLSYSTCLRRTHLSNRLAIVVSSKVELCEALNNFNLGVNCSNIVISHTLLQEPSMIFVYSGMGTQWIGMGKDLMRSNSTFLNMLQKCDDIFKQYTGWSLIDELKKDKRHSNIDKTFVAQPATFMMQVALTSLFESWGIIPQAVIGHSVGELSAAYVSGALSLEDAICIVYHRSRLQEKLSGQGGMLAVGISAEEILNIIQKYNKVSIAAINSPSFITLSGDLKFLHEISDKLTKQNIFTRFLRVQTAYHSSHMDCIKNKFISCINKIRSCKTTIPFYSSVFGCRINGERLNSEYWWANIRNKVNFAQGIKAVLQEKFNIFLEISSHPTLFNYIKELAESLNKNIAAIPTLKRRQAELEKLYEALGGLYVSGVNLDWDKILPKGGRYIRLPNYPWQREGYWQESARSKEYKFVTSKHIFLAENQRQPESIWECELNNLLIPYLEDHKIDEQIVFPGAAYVEIGLAVNREYNKQDICVLEDVVFTKMLVIDSSKLQKISTRYDPMYGRYFVYGGYGGDNPEWELKASGKISLLDAMNNDLMFSYSEWKNKCLSETEINKSEIIKILNSRSLSYGPYFQCINKAWKISKFHILAEINSDKFTLHEEDYLLHPTILDAVFQVFILLLDDLSDSNVPYVPVSIKKFSFYKKPKGKCQVIIEILENKSDEVKGNFMLFDDKEAIICQATDLICRSIVKEKNIVEITKLHRKLFNIEWILTKNSLEFNQDKLTKQWIIFTEQFDFAEKFMQSFANQKPSYVIVQLGNKYCKLAENKFIINRDSWSDLNNLFSVVHRCYQDYVLVCLPIADIKPRNSIDYSEIISNCVFFSNLAKIILNIQIPNCECNIVTNSAYLIDKTDMVLDMTRVALTGLGFLFGREIANVDCKLIDINGVVDNLYDILRDEICSYNLDSDVAYRKGKRLVKKILEDKFVINVPERILENNLSINQSLDYKNQINLIKSKQSKVDPVKANTSAFKKNGSYLITGGTSGFGLELAKWLSEKNVGKIILVSRKGKLSEYGLEVVNNINKRGTKVEVIPLDVSNKNAVQNIVANKLINTDFILSGIFHCAMVLDDGMIENMNKNRYKKVLAPKVLGAINLHNFTKHMPLDYFVLVSSVSSLIGNKGQANYVAANAFLDAFAYYRKARNFSALTINLGVLSDVGVVANNKQLLKNFAQLGIKSISSKEALKSLELALLNNMTQLGVFDFDWIKWSQLNAKLRKTSRFNTLINIRIEEDKQEADEQVDKQVAILNKLLGIEDNNEQINFLTSFIREKVAAVLGSTADKIEPTSDINRLGLDSLMVSELRGELLSDFKIELKMVELMRKISIIDLARLVREKIFRMLQEIDK